MADILSDRTMKARKSYVCDQCLQHIKVGERYRRQVHTFDGLVTYRAHEDCDKAALELRHLADLNSDECYLLHECADEDRPFLTESYPGVAARLWPVTLTSG